jgi:rubredoxin/mono/diheme cytochrome c family protein
MARYECPICGYVHDESSEGASWSSLSDDWTCPVCGAAKSQFRLIGEVSPPTGAVGAAAARAAPSASRALLAHRLFGYVFLAIYILLITQMAPRLWTYQIEFPARTVVHITLGMAIGVVLVLKIAIVRFFRRLDQTLVPSLGTFLLVGSVVLIGISVPTGLREALATGRLLGESNRERVRTLLAQTGLDETECIRLSTPAALQTGQRILRQQCVSCHDLRTVLAKPRTPDNWLQTVRRMADRTTTLNPLQENEQLFVTAYLVALSPDLQRSARQLRQQRIHRDRSQQTAEAITADEAGGGTFDLALAKPLFQSKCSQCHETTVIKEAPPANETEARELVARMVEEGLEGTPEELAQIVQFLTVTYAKSPK